MKFHLVLVAVFASMFGLSSARPKPIAVILGGHSGHDVEGLIFPVLKGIGSLTKQAASGAQSHLTSTLKDITSTSNAIFLLLGNGFTSTASHVVNTIGKINTTKNSVATQVLGLANDAVDALQTVKATAIDGVQDGVGQIATQVLTLKNTAVDTLKNGVSA